MNEILGPSQVLALTVPWDVGAWDRRQRILDAMADAVAEKTFSATTIADIVSRAGVSRATFYKQFAGKRSCFEVAVDAFVAELRDAAKGAHSSADPPAEAIRKASVAVLGLLAAKPAYTKLALIEAVAVKPTTVDRYRHLLVDALAAQWAPDELPNDTGDATRAAFGRAQVLIFDQIAAGRVEQLPELLPDLVYIALLSFAGPDEALKQAQLAR